MARGKSSHKSPRKFSCKSAKNSARTGGAKSARSASNTRQTPKIAPTLRIISGKWKGRKIYAPSAARDENLARDALDDKSQNLARDMGKSVLNKSARNKSISDKNMLDKRAPDKSISDKNALITRPSKSILKESCFNTIAQDIYGKIFIEGFAGSGSMGLEALSRGALGAVFCEMDSSVISVLRQNLALLGIIESKTLDSAGLESKKAQVLDSGALDSARENLDAASQPRAQIIQGDSFHALPKLLADIATPSILYLDPPFFIRQDYADIYEKCANLIAQISNDEIELVVIEHSSLYAFGAQIGRFALQKVKKFGKSSLTYFTQGA
ncbi:hypothetical protein BKN38_01560 [Helicobacter sp. CLO-3]|uniref:RsmD family RNA methyltransferase n=1 Tax=unclassified Helicobacter TaxID=2593540 RepID=UPI000804C07B|nr:MULTISPECIES: RsmD family RNA methyltransferase [unclassified Helicobacter]OBV29789.1 hypothetical protein BA723_00360 [Helicobacter sp. CLO-3]OHU85243.1 hypothetical protein BKN38_01560 [Helicobacter sp. CLO-3]